MIQYIKRGRVDGTGNGECTKASRQRLRQVWTVCGVVVCFIEISWLLRHIKLYYIVQLKGRGVVLSCVTPLRIFHTGAMCSRATLDSESWKKGLLIYSVFYGMVQSNTPRKLQYPCANTFKMIQLIFLLTSNALPPSFRNLTSNITNQGALLLLFWFY